MHAKTQRIKVEKDIPNEMKSTWKKESEAECNCNRKAATNEHTQKKEYEKES